jgi:serine-type D-Ala-D-Ala carboxypeptidase/endopeptidase
MDRRTFLLSSCANVLALRVAEAQTVGLADDAILKILRHRIDVERRATGMAVGVVEHGRRRSISHGTLSPSDSRRVSADTLFEIGSVTKVFTALVMADMMHHGELKFDDPVNRYLPSGVRTPDRNGRSITLADLATHTSGLPLFPFSPITTSKPLEALARFTVSDLGSWLAGFTLPRDPGAQWEYSNVGYGVLGLALANRAGMTYEALLNRRVIRPLKLTNTVLRPAEEPARRLAVGHDSSLSPVSPLDLGIFAPAGSLRSTVEDLLSFLSALLPNSRSPLEAPAQLLLSIRRPAPAVGGEQALGWDVVNGADAFLAKDGVTAGQAATIVLNVPRRTGVVVLSNAIPVKLQLPPGGGVGAADLARHLMQPAFPLG